LFACRGDAIVLNEDAVLALHSPITLASFLAKCNALDVKVYAQSEDCQLRGIQSQYADIELISYDDLVGLVVGNDKQVAW
jgi:sulfur relay protein TusB/DsrH